MKNKVSSLILGVLILSVTLVGCSDSTATTTPTQNETVSTTEVNDDVTVDDGGVIKIAASVTPHAEILAQAEPLMEELGYTLEVTEFTGYALPNDLVDSGELDANYFQHVPFMESYNEEQGTKIVSVGQIHYEPCGIYPGTESDLANITDGATIAIPNDTTNEARTLLLLQDNGLIKLADGVGLTATILDVEENPHNIEFIEMEAAQVARVKEEVSFVVLTGNTALQAGLIVSNDAIAFEGSDSDGAQTYVNIISVREGNENNAGVLALVDVLKSDEIVDFINETYEGAVIPFEG